MSVRILQSYRIAVVVILSSLIVLTVARVSMAQRQQAAVETGVNDQLITKFHGTEYLLANGAFAAAGKSFVIATITDAAAGRNGDVTVDFRVEDSDGVPVTGIAGAHFNIAKLAPREDGEAFNKWVPYIYRLQTVSNSVAGDWPNPDGTTAYQGYREAAAEGNLD